jgi:hypothetical protein
MSPFQDRREDTTLQLAHFRKHKRKQVKKTPGKAVINSVNKPIEHNPPGKDASNRIPRALGKAADMAGSNKARKVCCVSMAVTFWNLPCLLAKIAVISLKHHG